MRKLATAESVRRLIEALGRESRGPGSVYLTGGATAVLHGWRETTADVDLRLDPEPPGAFAAIRHLKDRLDLNIELASPADFIPVPANWRERSLFIARHGEVEFFHYAPSAQALAKIERGHARDLADVCAMIAAGLVDAPELRPLFDELEPKLERYPSIDPDAFRAKLEAFLHASETP